MSWRRQARDWTVHRGRQAQRYVHRVSARAMGKARMAGHRLAGRVLAVQRAAGLPDHMIAASARSVTTRPALRPADAAFREGYGRSIAARTMPPPEPAPEPASRPEAWPWSANLTPSDPEPGQ